MENDRPCGTSSSLNCLSRFILRPPASWRVDLASALHIRLALADLIRSRQMSIEKKSLISNRIASKKAAVPKPAVSNAVSTRVASAPKVQVRTAAIPRVRVRPNAVAMKANAVALKSNAVSMNS